MDKETLDSLGLAPSVIKENITVEGLDFSTIGRGQVFFVGDEVTLEVTGPCEPCGRMERDTPRAQGGARRAAGYPGGCADGGELRVGDTVRLEPSREALAREASR